MNISLWRNTTGPHRRPWTALLLPLILGACGGSTDSATSTPTVLAPLLQSVTPPAAAASPADPADPDDSADHSRPGASAAPVYSVINMGIEAGMTAALNSRGQAVFGNFGSAGVINGFFDGERVHDIGSLGGGNTISWGINGNGVVVGESVDGAEPFGNLRAFTWTVAEGMRALKADGMAQARAVNDARQVAGFALTDGITAQAARWNPDGSLRRLGPRPPSLSQANDINADGATTGFADVASGAIHAVHWSAAGAQTDLGTLGGSRAFGEHINAQGHVAGASDAAGDERLLAFFWSRSSGMVPIGAEGGGARLVAALNDRGEVAGNAVANGLSQPYLWSRKRGLALLPLGGAEQGDVFDLNKRGHMVGSIQNGLDWRHSRAVYWPGVSAPIDLNGRLHRPPAGLHLYAGAAINADGVILAHSNAGLVMLRPGKRGTNAPVLGPLQGLPDVVTVGGSARVTLGFTDNAPKETHKVSIDWGDGCASARPVVRESRGVGEATADHTFCTAGFFTVTVRVSDSGGRTTVLQRDLLVDNPALASVGGRGTLPAATGSQRPLQFALWAPLSTQAHAQSQAQTHAQAGPQALSRSQGAGRGAPFLELAGPFHFKSSAVGSVQRSGQLTRIEGDGSLNGRAGYRFLVEAVDGGSTGPDRVRVRVTHHDSASKAEVVDYDSATPAVAGRLRSASAATAAATRTSMAVADTGPAPLIGGGITLRN